MKKLLSLLACVALAATAAIAQTSSDVPVLQTKQAELDTWKRYKLENEHFSVMLPTLPAMTTNRLTIRSMRKTRRERMLGAYADGVVYSVYVYENITNQSLEDFIAQHIRRSAWDVSTETAVAANGVNGKQYASPTKGPDSDAMAQFFSNEGRLLKFSIGGDQVTDAVVKQFFSSIVLRKNPTGIEVNDGIGEPFEHAAGERVVTGKEVNRKVRLFQKPEPRYTEEARREQIVGTVVLKAVFSSSGSVTNIITVTELPHGLTEQAIAAAKKIKFIPAIKDGKYASMWMQLEYNFNLY